MQNKTKYFQNCLGVFQGGGCKGSAYVGAYKEAVKWGVSFSELVGTSAGSIIAVLIGAGASPEQLENIIKELDFKQFLNPPVRINQYQPPKFSKLARFIPLNFVRKYQDILTNLGLYNSQYLRDWIDAKLAELLPEKTRPIKFKDLIIPTNIVVTDIVTKRVEIFSQTTSSNKDVSEAVQCSCNIPFFFQPIDMRYVDGGLLSNLPSFIFEDTDKFYNKVLAFSLESDEVNESINDFVGFSKALINTTLDGNLDLQLALQQDLHIININTGNISATDFEKITPPNVQFLIKQGENAVNDFFQHEIERIHTKVNTFDIALDFFKTNIFLTQTLDYKYDEIIIANLDSNWVDELFPTLLKWLDNGSTITFFLNEATDKPIQTKFRQRFLSSLGVEIKLLSNLPFGGFIFDGAVPNNCKAIILNRTVDEPTEYHSKLYSGEEDFYAIQSMRESVNGFVNDVQSAPHKIIAKPQIKIEKADNVELFEALRRVKQYNNYDVQISMQEIDVSEVIFLTRYVRGYKYRQIHNLFELFTKYGIGHFAPAKLSLSNEKYTLFTPPVVEKYGNNYYLMEGNTRFFYAYQNGIKTLKSVVVEGVSDPLPSNGRFQVKELLLSDKAVVGATRYEDFDYKKFRSIENAVRNPESCLL